MQDGTLKEALGKVPEGITLEAVAAAIEAAVFRGNMRVARYNGLLEAAKEMIERRVRLAYAAILGTSIPLFIAWGVRLSMTGPVFDFGRFIVLLVGFAICWTALQIENTSHYGKTGEFLINAVDMENEDTSTKILGAGRIQADQHIRGNGLSSVGAAAGFCWFWFLVMAIFEASLM